MNNISKKTGAYSRLLLIAIPLLIILLIGFVSMSDNANTNRVPETPSFVKNAFYELFTDGYMLATQVHINDIPIPLENEDRNGSIGNNLYHVSGELGRANSFRLNSHLKPGNNEIRVTFTAPLLDTLESENERAAFSEDTYAHVVLAKGMLNERNGALSSYDLDAAIDENSNNIEILADRLHKRMNESDLRKSIDVVINLKLSEDDFLKVDESDCEIQIKNDYVFLGKTYVNGTMVADNHSYNSATVPWDNIASLLSPGENVIEIDVSEIKEGKLLNSKYVMECKLDKVIEESDLNEEEKQATFGQRWIDRTEHKVVFGGATITEPGKYQTIIRK